MEWAKNKPRHGEEQSDVAIQLEIQMDCRARQPGLAMTNHEFISRSRAHSTELRAASLPRGDAAIHLDSC